LDQEKNKNTYNDDTDGEITRNTSELINLGEKIITYKPKGVRQETIEIIQGLALKLKQSMENSKNLEKELDKMREEAEKLKKQITFLEEKNKSLEEELNNKIEELQNYIAGLEKDKGNLVENLSFVKDELSLANKKIESVELENKSLKEDNSSQKNIINSLENKILEEMEKENKKREAAEERFDAKVNEFRSCIKYLNEEIEELTGVNKFLTSELNSYIREVEVNEKSWSAIQETLKTSLDGR
jgi:chromosome segregation ATPase